MHAEDLSIEPCDSSGNVNGIPSFQAISSRLRWKQVTDDAYDVTMFIKSAGFQEVKRVVTVEPPDPGNCFAWVVNYCRKSVIWMFCM